MGRIDIQGGLERDEVYNKHGEKIGVAVYDLGDAQVRADLLTFKDDLKSLGEKYEKLALELQKNKSVDADGLPINAKELSDLNVKCVEEMIVEIDKVFGDGFCVGAIGNSKNPSDLWEVTGAVVESYGVKAKDEMSKFTNRAGRRAGSKK